MDSNHTDLSEYDCNCELNAVKCNSEEMFSCKLSRATFFPPFNGNQEYRSRPQNNRLCLEVTKEMMFTRDYAHLYEMEKTGFFLNLVTRLSVWTIYLVHFTS